MSLTMLLVILIKQYKRGARVWYWAGSRRVGQRRVLSCRGLYSIVRFVLALH